MSSSVPATRRSPRSCRRRSTASRLSDATRSSGRARWKRSWKIHGCCRMHNVRHAFRGGEDLRLFLSHHRVPRLRSLGAKKRVEPMADSGGAHVSEVDAFTMQLERDPLLRSTIVAVALYDCAPDWRVLNERIDRATRLAPTFREKLVSSPVAACPTALGRRPGLRPELASPAGSRPRVGRDACRADLRPERRHGGIRPRPTALGVHAPGGPARRSQRPRDEGPPLPHRRHRRHPDRRARHRPRA